MMNGIDISSWQGNIDLSKVPCDFVIIKGTGGVRYVNPYCDSHFQLAKKLDKSLGVYHFAKEVGMSGTATQEAEFFVKNCGGYFNGDAIPILDWEPNTGSNDVAWVLEWLRRVEQLTGIKPLFYTYSSVIENSDFSQVFKNGYGLWVANYGVNAITNGYKQPNSPVSKGFDFTAMYQYNSRTLLNGYSGYLDANVFYGDKVAWSKYAKPNNKNPAPKPVQPQQSVNNNHDNAIDTIANEVIQGRYGNGVDVRKNNIYNEVQQRVNKILG